MDVQEQHRARVAQLHESFAAAYQRLLQRLSDAAELEAAGTRMLGSLDSLGSERASSYGITSPIVGAINLYQIAEWATAHTIRHNRQAEVTLGR